MELVFGRGLKCSYFLVPRTSTISINIPTFLCKCPKLTAHRQIQNLARHLDSSYQTINFNIFNNNNHGKIHESGSLTCKIDKIQYSSSTKSDTSTKTEPPNKDCYAPPPVANKSVFQRMKQMTKDYWHILIPVHLVTSLGWASMFYIAAKNGVDIVGMLESLNLSEKYLGMLRGSNAGHWAVTYALYKVFTPLRYTVTLGGTTMCIRYLNKWGYLKFPMKKDPKLVQSIKCAEEHKSTYAKSNTSSKSNQPQSPKT